MTRSDFHALVELLYDNLDLFATSLKELTGCTVLKHRIETGNSPPEIDHQSNNVHIGNLPKIEPKLRDKLMKC